ncbi:MAG TPA: addiction module protein [Pirellulales bacterium]
MEPTFASLGLDHLTIEQKREFLRKLGDDLAASAPPGATLSEAQREELQRRVEHANAHPNEWISWEDAKTDTLRRLSR